VAYRGVLDDVARAVALRRPDRLPVFACSEECDVRLAGSRYDLYNRDAREIARVQKEAVERFDWDWVWLQVDDCIEFEPLGIATRGEGDILPATVGYLAPETGSLERLRAHGYRVEGRMRVLLDAIGELKAHFGDRVVVCGRTAAPFSSVALAFGITETLTLLYENPGIVREALAFFEDYQRSFGLEQIRAGADALWFGDCNASGHLISPEHYARFARPSASRVARAYREAGATVFYHASEELPAMVSLQAEAGFSILSVGPGIDIETARRASAGKVCLCGNVDPIAVLARGTPERVRSEVRRIVDAVSVHGAHVMCSGEMVPRETPEENLRAYVRAAREPWPAL
jgi:uroporphyrinogen decarboxylase